MSGSQRDSSVTFEVTTWPPEVVQATVVLNPAPALTLRFPQSDEYLAVCAYSDRIYADIRAIRTNKVDLHQRSKQLRGPKRVIGKLQPHDAGVRGTILTVTFTFYDLYFGTHASGDHYFEVDVYAQPPKTKPSHVEFRDTFQATTLVLPLDSDNPQPF